MHIVMMCTKLIGADGSVASCIVQLTGCMSKRLDKALSPDKSAVEQLFCASRVDLLSPVKVAQGRSTTAPDRHDNTLLLVPAVTVRRTTRIQVDVLTTLLPPPTPQSGSSLFDEAARCTLF